MRNTIIYIAYSEFSRTGLFRLLIFRRKLNVNQVQKNAFLIMIFLPENFPWVVLLIGFYSFQNRISIKNNLGQTGQVDEVCSLDISHLFYPLHSQTTHSPPQPVFSQCAETPGLFTSPFWLSHLQQFVINVRSRPGGYNYVVVGILLLGGSLELVEGKQ